VNALVPVFLTEQVSTSPDARSLRQISAPLLL
jgi:hypothetical protein